MSRVVQDYLGARWDDEVQARFWSKVDRREVDDCWPWTGQADQRGYGRFSIDSRNYAAHRLLTVKLANVSGEGLVCDHLCRNPRCVNPGHIEMVTQQTNVKRGLAVPMIKARSATLTHCCNGHEFTPENTGRYKGRFKRRCRTCAREQMAVYRARRRASGARSDQPDSSNEGLAELLRLAEDCAAELEAEVRHRWGDDIRLAHKVERDLSTAVELRKAIAALSTGRQA